MTGAQTRESLEWLAEPLTRTGVTTAMSLDISQENAPRGIMAIIIIDHNSTGLFQDLNVVQPQMYAQMPVPQMAQVPVQMAVQSAQVQMQNNSMTESDSCYGTHERGDDANARCDCR